LVIVITDFSFRFSLWYEDTIFPFFKGTCMSTTNATGSACGMSAAQDGLRTIPCTARRDAAFSLPQHPCFNEAAHGRIARIHVPVAPRCNLACAYCERIISPRHDLSGPGSASGILSPEQGLERTLRFLDQYGEHAIVGIAGPGDPLANEETFSFLELLNREVPHVATCLCTNGLALPEHADRLIRLGVRTLTVTMNGVTPQTVAAMQPGVCDNGTWLDGEEAARLLIARQIAGLRALAGHMTLKVNMVVAPEVNMHEAEAVMRTAEGLGVQVFNPMPLIPRHALAHRRKPTREELHTVYAKCPPGLALFRKCKQCRADAAGIHGKESFGCQTIDQV
jgi:nitrogen fixation protein NifB